MHELVDPPTPMIAKRRRTETLAGLDRARSIAVDTPENAEPTRSRGGMAVRARRMLVALAVAGLDCRPTPPVPPTDPPRDPPRERDVPDPAAPVVFEATRERQAVIPCFEPGLMRGDRPATCELSGVAAVDDGVLVVNDKPIPPGHGASVMRVRLDALSDPAPVGVEALEAYRKYEGVARDSDGGLLLTTGFDRIHDDDAQWDHYNALVYWPRSGAPRLLAASERSGRPSSRALRDGIRSALAADFPPQGPPYFKIEGLAALDDGRILLGVRELGETYQAPRFVMAILVAGDLAALDRAELRPAWRFAPDPAQTEGHPVGLSGLAFDRDRAGLWLLTSWEVGQTDEDLGGALWWLPLTQLDEGRAPTRVVDPEGAPLVFAHKPEGITVLADGRLFVVCDDDRVTGRPPEAITDPVHQFSRGLHTSAVEILAVRPR